MLIINRYTDPKTLNVSFVYHKLSMKNGILETSPRIHDERILKTMIKGHKRALLIDVDRVASLHKLNLTNI